MPSGLPLVQHALVSLLEQFHHGRFSLELIVRKSAHAPAEIFGVVDRGYVREGYWADLVLVDLNLPLTVGPRKYPVQVRLVAVRRTHFQFIRGSDLAEW